jgi:hypothetical protein
LRGSRCHATASARACLKTVWTPRTVLGAKCSPSSPEPVQHRRRERLQPPLADPFGHPPHVELVALIDRGAQRGTHRGKPLVLEAIKAIQIEAGRRDARLKDAERRAAEAEKQAKRDRRERQDAVSKVDGLRAEIVRTRASVAAEVETLKTEKEFLAQRDRQAREELDRLRLGELQRLGRGKQINPRGVTAGG